MKGEGMDKVREALPELPASQAFSKLVVNGRRVYLGVFATPEEAHSAYVEAKRLHHDGCTL